MFHENSDSKGLNINLNIPHVSNYLSLVILKRTFLEEFTQAVERRMVISESDSIEVV